MKSGKIETCNLKSAPTFAAIFLLNKTSIKIMMDRLPDFMYQNQSGDDPCQSITASFELLPSLRLRILIPKNNLPPTAIQYYFADQQFVMPVDFELPVELLREIGIDYYRIHAGVYQVQENNEYIMVDV